MKDISAIIIVICVSIHFCNVQCFFTNIYYGRKYESTPKKFQWVLKSATETSLSHRDEIETRLNGALTSNLLVPVSLDPLMFKSSKPLLSKRDCRELSSWCKQIVEKEEKMTSQVIEDGEENNSEGAKIMIRLQKMIHEQVLGLPTPTSSCLSDGYVVPRFLSYERNNEGENNDSTTSRLILLPDGLHVDTNNGHHFRHWTILFYLDTCNKQGATIFPLATPFEWNLYEPKLYRVKKAKTQLNEAQEDAKKLIMEDDVQHTRKVDASEESLKLGRIIENEAVSLFQKVTSTNDYNDNGVDENQKEELLNMGVRMMPRRGHFCLFSNLRTNGYPNPLSFHGGEAIGVEKSKEVLTFFYEIPLETFMSREEFGYKVKERENNLLNFHFPTK